MMGRVLGVAAFLIGGLAFGPTEAQPQSGRSTPDPGAIFRDCLECPEMVNLPPGTFVMGSPAAEKERYADETRFEVRIGPGLAVGRFEITRGQYAQFLRESNYVQSRSPNCAYLDFATSQVKTDDPGRDWMRPGFEQDDQHPVVCVSWFDAKGYVAWLSRKTGRSYRLLSEAEWEYAARAGTTTARPWGDDPGEACGHSNVGDRSRDRRQVPGARGRWNEGHD